MALRQPGASNDPAGPSARDVLPGGGEMGALMRSIDWANTAVGPVHRWPQSLRTALSILLETGFPMYIAWGPEFTQFYNDGYRPILGSTKHPAAMGIGTRQTFAEIWNIIGPMFEGVMRGTPVNVHDFHLPLDRHGFVEECYFVFSYSPIREETGSVGGVLVTVTETTERVLGARRLATLQALAAQTQNVATAHGAFEIAEHVLADNPADVPFALLYLLDEEGRRATLEGAVRIARGTDASPRLVDLTERPTPWSLGDVCAMRQPQIVGVALGVAAAGIGDGAPPAMRAFAQPIFTPGAERPSGVLVAALSPRLVFDAKYRSFLELVAGHMGSAIASVRALEEAKGRADALAEIDRAKTAFFSNVSHEFRTPLTLILGPSEEALDAGDALPREERARWSLVYRNALRLSKLVNTLLDFSRIEAGRVQACYEPTDLGAVTAELVSMFRSAVNRGGLQLRLALESVGEPAYVDREMWEKIVMNLLSNALKFTFEGEIFVSLRAVDTAFELAVRDTGIGIAPADLPFVFDRFHRVRGARARTDEGTGIGLALVAELVKLHGGHAHVESTVGEGTTFVVRLPRGHAHLPADRIGAGGASRAMPSSSTGAGPYVEEALRWEPAAPEAAAPSVRPNALPDARPDDGPRARIVLADDNADMREYIARLLRERWDVEAVSGGAHALTAIRRAQPDLVLADVMMPGLDGFGLVRAIQQDPALRLTPVILLSARAGQEATAEGLGVGATDYIVKPFSARELLVRVASRLAAARVASEARAVEMRASQELARLLANAEVSERQFRELVENLPELAWTARPDGHVDYFNRRWYEYTGRTFEEMRGWGWISILAPSMVDSVVARWQRSIDTGEPFEMEFPLLGARDELRWFLTRVRPLRDAEGRLVRWFGSNTDIDERRRNDDFKETFVGILGHDLRNPLNTILMTTRVLVGSDDISPEWRKRLERVVASGVRMQRMIDQLLDLTRARLAGGIPIDLAAEALDLAVLVTKIVDEVRAAHPQATIDLRLEAGCAARVDADRFEQVVSNLVGNAVTHGDLVNPIRVALASRAGGIVLSVHNFGKPIDPGLLPTLFNPFARAKRPHGRAAGLGLGLYISERIIDAHRGKLSVRAPAEGGTMFEVFLPTDGERQS